MSEEWYPGQAYVHKHNANIRRAEERAMARNQDYKTDLYADLRDFDKAVEYVRACAIEGALDIALRDVLAANRPQASSEVREAHLLDRAEKIVAKYWPLDRRLNKKRQDLVHEIADALAPSRQGAGGTPCKHERLNEEGICRSCGEDCRGIHS